MTSKPATALEWKSKFEYAYRKDLLPPQYRASPGEFIPEKEGQESPALLFRPLKIRSLTLKNRIIVPPMCQYSSPDGYMTDWHLRHYGDFAVGGVGLIIIEATGVTPNGRITPNCSGIYHQGHVEGFKRIVDFIHANGAAAGIQLAHAGRKSSTLPPFLAAKGAKGYRIAAPASPEYGGWPDNVVGPSALQWDENHCMPRELTKKEMKDIIDAFVVGTKRALEAGFDVIEIHGAHGYLICSFLSPLSNIRTDEYGGSFENRIRFPLEITRAVRKAWPSDKPLFFRLSCTEWVEGGWDIEDSVKFAKILKQEGVDLLDCSSGGNDPRQGAHLKKARAVGPFNYQIDLAERIKASVPGLLVGAVGVITSPTQAETILQKNQADFTLIGRQMQREPFWALRAGRELKVNVGWPGQMVWGAKLPIGVDDRTLHLSKL